MFEEKWNVGLAWTVYSCSSKQILLFVIIFQDEVIIPTLSKIEEESVPQTDDDAELHPTKKFMDMFTKSKDECSQASFQTSKRMFLLGLTPSGFFSVISRSLW